MKGIIKQREPKELIDFRLDNKNVKENLDYRNLGSKERIAIIKALLIEQGYLCAYTMKRISYSSSHIEHIKPESLCRKHMEEGIDTVSDLDYINMIACFPKDGMKAKMRYGAHKKDDWWINDGREFISPLSANCEDHFSFDMKGEISGETDSGKETINILKLDHKVLTADRKRAIDAFIYDKHQKPISKSKAQTAIEEITKLHGDKYPECCVCIRFALQEYVVYLDKLAKKRQYIKSDKNKK